MPLTQPNGLNTHLCVLVVDDFAITRRLICKTVKNLGFKTLQASGGAEALRVFKAEQPDIVLLDLLMPEIDGFAVTRAIKSIEGERWTPVVVISGLEGDAHLLKALQAQADDFLHKPISAEILGHKLNNLARVLNLQKQHSALLTRSRAITENNFDGILVVDPQQRVQGINFRCEQLFHAKREQLIGRSLSELLPKLQLNDALEAGLHSQVLLTQGLDGSELPVEVGVTFFYQDNALYLLATVRDISERQRVDQLKQQFIATLSHELRTPLTSIIGALKMLHGTQAAQFNATSTQLIEMADRNAGRLLKMVNELLDINRSASGSLQLDLQWYLLSELLAEALLTHAGYAAQHQVNIELALAPEISNAQLQTDHHRLMQILGNLISNACKFSPKAASVTVRAYINDAQLILEVEDQGCGIPVDFQPRLFTPFSQAEAGDARIRGGSGLGLAITKQLIEAMSGQINYRTSELGTCFKLTFPRGALQCKP
ncbi:ATP-binding response regulator [Deefgea salmonis]|uniref:histidine kinase n=1 Tax=Deefgea salmonis TaxID=2875502 RepID=A0ABS8BNZ3_9NEIS|nr:ATP-binding protein [Deefgea salmonis]MCB5197196.1 response regulator [Deefgea salmonis]